MRLCAAFLLLLNFLFLHLPTKGNSKELRGVSGTTQDNGALKIYPTNVNDLLILEDIPEKFLGGVLRIYSLTGEQILYKLIDNNSLKVFTSSLLPGLYFVSLSNGPNKICIRISKN